MYKFAKKYLIWQCVLFKTIVRYGESRFGLNIDSCPCGDLGSYPCGGDPGCRPGDLSCSDLYCGLCCRSGLANESEVLACEPHRHRNGVLPRNGGPAAGSLRRRGDVLWNDKSMLAMIIFLQLVFSSCFILCPAEYYLKKRASGIDSSTPWIFF